jgi:two-component system NarL family sensor kinase
MAFLHPLFVGVFGKTFCCIQIMFKLYLPMKLIPYLICLILVLPLYGHAQNYTGKNYKDSLENILTLNTSDSIKGRACFLLSEEWNYTDTLKAKRFLERGKKLSGKNKYLHALYYFYAAKLSPKNIPGLAAKIYLKAKDELKKFGTKDALSMQSMSWNYYAKSLRFEKDDPETSLDILLNNAVPLALRAGDSLCLGQNYLDIAKNFKNITEYRNAEVYLLKAIETLKGAPGSIPYLASAYHTLSENYSLSGDAYKIPGNAVKAAAMLDSMKRILMPYPDAVEWLDYYAGEGMRLTVAEQPDKSLAIINKGIVLAKKLNQVYPEQRLLLQKFYALYNKKDFLQAKDVALDLSKRHPFMNVASNKAQMFYGLSVTYKELKNVPDAYKWLEKYSSLSDSISSSNLKAKVSALEIKFRNAENKKKIAELNAANTKAAFDAKNSRLINWLLGAVSLFLLVVAILSLFFFRSYKRSSAQKAQIGITKAMIEVQEEERSRVARDLHDGLGGMLTTVKLNLEDFAQEEENTDNIELQNIIKQLNGSVKELRRIAHNMMPEMLLNLGLEASLKDLCELLATKNLHIDFQCLGIQNSIRMEAKITIYRIIQELLTNIVKHANAKNVLLQCAQHGTVFFITIEDDGKGFDTDLLGRMSGIGLSNIKNRVAYLQGKIELLSKNDQGTSINIELNVTI